MSNALNQKALLDIEHIIREVVGLIESGVFPKHGPIKTQAREKLRSINENDIQPHIDRRLAERGISDSDLRTQLLGAVLIAQTCHKIALKLEVAAADLDQVISNRFTPEELNQLTTIEEVKSVFGYPPALEKALAEGVSSAIAMQFVAVLLGKFQDIDVTAAHFPEILDLCESLKRVRVANESLDQVFRLLKIPCGTRTDLSAYDFHEFDPTGSAGRIGAYNKKVADALTLPEDRCFVPTVDAGMAARDFISHDQGRWELAAEQTAESAKHGREGQKAAQKTFRKKHDNKLLFLREVVRLAKVSNSKPLQDLSDLAIFIQDTQNAHIRKEAAKGLGKLPSMETFAGGLIKNRERDKEVWQPIRDNLIEWIGKLKAGQTSSKNVARNRQRYER